MSETVHYKGKLVKIMFDNFLDKSNDIEEKCKYLLNSLGEDRLLDWHDNWQDFLYDEYYGKYVIYKNDIYKIIEKKRIDECDIFDISHNSDGTYNFDVMYYNGGCSFNKAIEQAFKNYEKENNE